MSGWLEQSLPFMLASLLAVPSCASEASLILEEHQKFWACTQTLLPFMGSRIILVVALLASRVGVSVGRSESDEVQQRRLMAFASSPVASRRRPRFAAVDLTCGGTDVHLSPCRSLCPGCLPMLCPLAPQRTEQDLEKAPLSQSGQQRLVELHPEEEQMGNVAAEIVTIDSRRNFDRVCGLSLLLALVACTLVSIEMMLTTRSHCIATKTDSTDEVLGRTR